MTAPNTLPNPFVSGHLLASEPPRSGSSAAGTGLETVAAVVGDAPAAAATPFQPDMNRLYLDIVSMPEPPVRMPLFLRAPSLDYIRACFDNEHGRFIDPETGSDRRYD